MKGPGPLLYRPAPRWQAVTAFGGAIAVHLAAVAIAAIHPKEEILDLSQIPEAGPWPARRWRRVPAVRFWITRRRARSDGGDLNRARCRKCELRSPSP